MPTLYPAVIWSFLNGTSFSELKIIIYLLYHLFFWLMIVVNKVRMFHTVCRTRQFFNDCSTTCYFGISWTTLSQSTFHAVLFRVSLSNELQFGIDICLLINLFIFVFQEEKSYELNVASTRGTCSNLTLNTFTLFGEKYKLWLCCLYNMLCPLFR